MIVTVFKYIVVERTVHFEYGVFFSVCGKNELFFVTNIFISETSLQKLFEFENIMHDSIYFQVV